MTQEDMMRQVVALQAKADAKRQKAAKSEQKKIDALEAQMERVAAQESDEPRLIPMPELARKISPEEEEAQIAFARESLRTFGTIMPPKEAMYVLMKATCPHCDPEGKNPRSIATEFGFKKYRSNPKDPTTETIRPQSWCRDCRNGKDSHPTRNKG